MKSVKIGLQELARDAANIPLAVDCKNNAELEELDKKINTLLEGIEVLLDKVWKLAHDKVPK